MEALITTAELAVALNLKPQTVRKLRFTGAGPKYVLLSRNRVGYRREDVEEWLVARSFSSTSEATVASSGR
jgi:predicted DNA-binding transcriptional regulator AlpA